MKDNIPKIKSMIEESRANGGLMLQFKPDDCSFMFWEDLNSAKLEKILQADGVAVRKYPISHRSHLVKLEWY